MSKERERCQIKEVFDHISGNQATLNQLYLIILQETRPRSTNCIRSYFRKLGHAQLTVFDHISGNQATLNQLYLIIFQETRPRSTNCIRSYYKKLGHAPYPKMFNFVPNLKIWFIHILFSPFINNGRFVHKTLQFTTVLNLVFFPISLFM